MCISDVLRSVAEQNMGRATAGANRICAVKRPERNAVERERSGARLKGASLKKQTEHKSNFSNFIL